MLRMSLGAVFLLSLLPAVTLAQSAEPSAPERGEARQKVRAACAADVQKFCANIERAKGAMRACLEQHQANCRASATQHGLSAPRPGRKTRAER